MKYAALATLTLSLCGHGQDGRICEKVPTAIKSSYECVHRQAYLLASADGTITEISKSVAAKCEHLIVTRYFRIKQSRRFVKLPRTSAQLADLEIQAAKRVVEARAGKCDKPE
jgi:hypothetical protein